MKVLIYIFFCIMTLATLGSCGSRKDKTAHVNRMVYHAVADTLPLSYNDIVTTALESNISTSMSYTGHKTGTTISGQKPAWMVTQQVSSC